MEHVSVLLRETVDLLNVRPEGIYCDATLGRGGHTRYLAEKLTTGKIYAIDKDAQAIEESKVNLKSFEDRVTFIHGDFRDIRSLLENAGVRKLDGLMMDLGVSSPQFDDPERGFSYRYDARLDMRMDRSQEKTAYMVVNTYTEKDLIRILREYGEERYAPLIARAIVRQRQAQPISTTYELTDVIRSALPERELHKKGHPAKQTFQALRIEVNDELTALKEGLQDALSMLDHGGRCAVITFHSLEDKIVKRMFKDLSTAPFADPRLPLKETQMEQASFSLITRKPVTADEEELEENHRSHSAKLRVIERI